MRKIFYWILVIGFLVVLAFVPTTKKNTVVTLKGDSQLTGINNIKQIKIAEATLNVELALTEQEQEQGLSGRTELKENSGMLFVFDSPGKYSFWMKNMNFPIDMIWISQDMSVVYIKKNASPESYPAAFTPEKDSKYVLETVSGFSERNNLKVGDVVEFNY